MKDQFGWVEDTLFTHLYAELPELKGKVAHKNLTFDPSNLTLWLKVINTPVSEYSASLGPTGDNECVGFLQFGIYSELGAGMVEANTLKRKLNKSFSVPKQLAIQEAPTGCMLRLTRKDFSQGGQTSISDFTRGGTEKMWDADYLTVYWLAREPR